MEFIMDYEFIKGDVSNLPIKIDVLNLFEDNYATKMHYHDEIEILMGIEHKLTAKINDESVELLKDDILIIDSRVPHSTILPAGLTYLLWQFDADKFEYNLWSDSRKHLFKFLKRSKSPYVLLKSGSEPAAELRNILISFSELSNKKEKGYETYIKGYVYILLGFMYRNGILQEVDKSYDEEAVRKVQKSIAFIDECYAEKISLEDISKVSNLNEFYFCRLFKRATGGTVIDYLNFVRIQEAKIMLIHTQDSISKIAYDVGFSNLAYFNRLFKKLNAATPSQYRRLRA